MTHTPAAAGVGFDQNEHWWQYLSKKDWRVFLAAWLGVGMALAILSVGFALIVILSIWLNIPRTLQRAVDSSVVRPEDGNDEIVAKIT